MRLENGGQAAANIDYFRPKGAPSHGDDRLRVAGADGVVEVMDHKTMLITPNGVEELPLEEPKAMFAEFLRSIDDETSPYRQSHDDVYALTDVCIRAQESADRQ